MRIGHSLRDAHVHHMRGVLPPSRPALTPTSRPPLSPPLSCTHVLSLSLSHYFTVFALSSSVTAPSLPPGALIPLAPHRRCSPTTAALQPISGCSRLRSPSRTPAQQARDLCGRWSRASFRSVQCGCSRSVCSPYLWETLQCSWQVARTTPSILDLGLNSFTTSRPFLVLFPPQTLHGVFFSGGGGGGGVPHVSHAA